MTCFIISSNKILTAIIIKAKAKITIPIRMKIKLRLIIPYMMITTAKVNKIKIIYSKLSLIYQI
ncbi:MAG: hypothetical protein EAX96_17035 [Candidatus Lokiarchaeota archaeon]|nr:hypothetical protein [Candidatus Lokiarchaeota archaeon]